MEYPRCALCGSEKSETFVQVPASFGDPSKLFRFVCCQDCGLVFLKPRPSQEEIQAYYPATYWGRGTEQRTTLFTQFGKWRIEQSLRWAVHQVSGIKEDENKAILLDVGCGNGSFLKAVRMANLNAMGCDLALVAVQRARTMSEAPVFVAEGSQLPCRDHAFDVLTAWEVLEHLPDPRGALKEWKRLLKPGGVLFLSTPNIRALARQIAGLFWVEYSAPLHFYLFSPRTVEALLTGAGFSEIRFLVPPPLSGNGAMAEGGARQVERWLQHSSGFSQRRLVEAVLYALAIVPNAVINVALSEYRNTLWIVAR